MIFTRSTGYALLALSELSKLESPIDSQSIAKKLQISQSFLAKLLQNMAKSEFVKSYKGINGGFVLNKEPHEIYIIDVFHCVEDKDSLVYECAKAKEDCARGRASVCSIWPFLNLLEEEVSAYLGKFTLEDVIKAKHC